MILTLVTHSLVRVWLVVAFAQPASQPRRLGCKHFSLRLGGFPISRHKCPRAMDAPLAVRATDKLAHGVRLSPAFARSATQVVFMNKVITFALLSLLATATEPSMVQKQSQIPIAPGDDIERVETTLVTVPVSVRDRKGRLVAGLKREDFRLYEDGVEQELVYCEPPEVSAGGEFTASSRKPLTVALMLDVSDSTEFKLAQIQAAALAFVNLLRPEDRIILVSFDKRINVLTEATNDREVLREAIKYVHTGGGTSLYAALDAVIKQRLRRVVGSKAVVLLTDGVDTTSVGITSADTLRAAEESDIAIYPVQYDTYADFADSPSRETYGVGNFGAVAHVTRGGEPASEAYKRATLYLRLLADKTGGQFHYTDSLKNLSRTFDSIAAQLREQYTLGYYPKSRAGGTQRQIKVEVSVPRAVVRARKNYTYRSAAVSTDRH